MGLERRDTAQGSGPALSGRWAPWRISHALIAVNVLVYLAWQWAPAELMRAHFVVSWGAVFDEGRAWTLITAACSHQDLVYLLWNMLLLNWFGGELERLQGRGNVLTLFLHAALVGSLAHVVGQHLVGGYVPALGASGAVTGLAVVAALVSPRRTVSLLFVLPVPLWALAGVGLLVEFTGTLGSSGAWSALGGAAAGVTFKLLDLRVFNSPGEVAEGWRWPWQPRARTHSPATEPVEPEAHTDVAAHVDDLLRKISQHGLQSLSEDELSYLRQASARYKRPAS